MKSVSLSGSRRENVGKKDAKKHRREGNIPCVIYGGKEQGHFLVNEKAFSKLLFTPEVSLVKLDLDGQVVDAIIQDVQYHPVTDHVLHVDFLQIMPDKPVIIAVPVKESGIPAGVLKGGRLIKKARKVKVKALAEDLPDFISVDISGLDIGDSIKVSDLKADKVLFLDPPTDVIIGVRTARAVVEEVAPGAEEAAAEGAAPAEGEKKEEAK
jgi:large subunit ribosomal protein L25